MKKIGIITIHNSPNYGASLQSYALYKYIELSGNEVEIIDLHRPIANKDYIPSKRYKRSREVRQSLLTKLKSWIKHLSFLNKREINGYSAEAECKFSDFNKHIRLSKPYRSIDELYTNPPIYDLYIAGSDQLWNPTQGYCIEPYFLTFVPHGIGKKISFATSIGITDLRENEKIDFKRWLSKFDDISVRELQAQQMLQELLKDKKVHQVADPTFLMEPSFWQQLAVKPQKEGYILLFTLGRNDSLLSYGIKLSKESGLPLVSLRQVQPDAPNSEYIAVKDAGPKEFLGYISQADMVITDSFHCTVFSLIMGAKNFYTYIDPKNCRGSRIVDLLETYNLKNHLLDTSLLEEYNKLKARTVNHEEIFRIMSQERLRSQEFLNQYL